MQVKKFEAPTIQEALDNIKRELGPEAIILQTKKYKRGFGLMSKASVEVTAAISDRSLQKKQFTERRLPEKTKTELQAMPAPQQAKIYNEYVDKHLDRAARATQDRVEIRYVDIPDDKPATAAVAKAVETVSDVKNLEQEVQYLKRMLQEVKSAQEVKESNSLSQMLLAQGPFSTPALQEAYEQLVINGIDKRYALSLIKEVSFELGSENSKDSEKVLDKLAMQIINHTEVLSPLGGIKSGEGTGPTIIALVGPTGVGKTTTVAKIASEALHRLNFKTGLINVDCHKMGAFDQLATYAKILNVPFRSASSTEDLKAAILDFKNLDFIMVDTTGRSQRDPNSLKELQTMLQVVPQMKTHLVLSATTRDAELYDMATRFSLFRPQGIIISKLDEATLYGALYNVSQKVKLPLLYFTTGQRVPEDIEEATRERLASLILEI